MNFCSILILLRSIFFHFLSHRFVNLSPDIADNFKCSICLGIFKDPFELPCGHTYCNECIHCHLSINSSCPECRRSVESIDIKPSNNAVISYLNNLNIKCEFDGCRQVVGLEQLNVHSKECRFRPPDIPQRPIVIDVPTTTVQRTTNNNVKLAAIIVLGVLPLIATVIGVINIDSCTQIPMLPYILMALGGATIASITLETARNCQCEKKSSIVILFIECVGVGFVIYLAVLVFSNISYVTFDPTSPQYCDHLLFTFSYLYVVGTLGVIGIIVFTVCLILCVKSVSKFFRST